MERKPLKDRIDHLISYRWGSLPGFINKRKKEGFIDYAMVLDEYGGDTGRARKEYKKRIYEEISNGIDIKERKRLRGKLHSDRKLRALILRLEGRLSSNESWPHDFSTQSSVHIFALNGSI